MATREDRNILRSGPPAYWFQGEITPAMVGQVCERITGAGGVLTLWAVMMEDEYETLHGDGLFFALGGIALNEADADRLVTLASAVEGYRWHIRTYRIGLIDGAPALLDPWPSNEEFTVNDVVEILAEIPPDGTVSRVMTGSGWEGRKPGPHMLALLR